MTEYLIRLLYCEMLGHIHAVTFTQSNNIVDKRIVYLTCSLVLHPDHELNMLLVNSIQRVGSSHLCMYMYIHVVRNKVIYAQLPMHVQVTSMCTCTCTCIHCTVCTCICTLLHVCVMYIYV